MRPSVKKALDRCRSGYMDPREFLGICQDEREPPESVANDTATIIARSFLSKELSFDDAGALINCLYHSLIEHAPAAESAFAVYDAFDEGEQSASGKDHTEKRLRVFQSGA